MATAASSTASTQSCFWAIVALVVNSAVQPAGKICGLSLTPINRLSPILQVCNAIDITARVGFESARRKWNVREAAGVIARQNRVYDLTFTSTPTTAPERIWWFRAIVFFLGALPQAIKMMAIRGDAVSQVLALCYAIPFVVVELLEWLGSPPLDENVNDGEDEDPEKVTEAGELIRAFLIPVSLSISVELMTLLSLKYLLGEVVEVDLFRIFVLLGFTLLALMVSSVIAQSLEASGAYPVLLLLSVLVFYSVMARWQHPELKGHGAGFLVGPILFAVASFVQFWVAKLLRSLRLLRRHSDDAPWDIEAWFGSWSVTWILIYYVCFFDSNRTYKPAWTEWLG